MDNSFTVIAALVAGILASVASIASTIVFVLVEFRKLKNERFIKSMEIVRANLVECVSEISVRYSAVRKEETFDSYWELMASLYKLLPQVNHYEVQLEIRSFIDQLRELASHRPFSLPNETDNAFYSLMVAMSHYISQIK